MTTATSRLRSGLINLAVSAASVLVFLLFCEFVLFRFVLPGSDVPRNAFVNEVVRYQPGQTGTWRIRNEVSAPFSINADGWNSPVPAFALPRKPGVERIAFVGDSYVEALQVPFSNSFAEAVLARRGQAAPVEGYRYGLAGAPMTQYLQMVRREVVRARPDRIVVLLVHNDFDESFVFLPGRYTSSFLKLRVEGGRVLGEVPPAPFREGLLEGLRRSATARFLLYRWQVRPQVLVNAILGPARADGGGFSANVDVAAVLSREADIRVATDYVFRQLKEQADSIGARLHFVMDGDRGAIYAGRPDSRILVLNRIAEATAAKYGVPFLDLHPVFAADWARNRKRFEFDADAHWNEHGHAVAGAAIADSLK